jgi:DnaJ-class molecular chaperone
LPAASRYARGAVSADEETPEAPEPVPCTVCRGTGTLISNLGGSPNEVPCAWCEGTGTFLADHDAQAARRAAAEAAGETPAQPTTPEAETD